MKTFSCSVVLLTHTSHVPAWIEELAGKFEEILVWHDSDSSSPPPQINGKHVRVENHSLQNNFAEHRNAALQEVSSEWTLFLDQDEELTLAAFHELREAIRTNQYDAIAFHRYDWFLGRLLLHGEVGSVTLVRCARTRIGMKQWQRAVHEVWRVPTLRIYTMSHGLVHCPCTTYTDFLTKLTRYAQLEPATRVPYSRSRAIIEFTLYPMGKFFQNYGVRGGWKDGWPGLVHALSMSYFSAITRVFLYESAKK